MTKPVRTAQEVIEAARVIVQCQCMCKPATLDDAIRAIPVAPDPLIADLEARHRSLCNDVACATQRFTKAEAERDDLKAKADKLAELLLEYRTKTPLGHQPHMIAARVDAALAEYKADQPNERPPSARRIYGGACDG